MDRRYRLAIAAALAVGLIVLIRHGSSPSPLDRPMRAAVLAQAVQHPGPSQVFAGAGSEVFIPAQLEHRDLTLIVGCVGTSSVTFSVGPFEVADKCATGAKGSSSVTSDTFPAVPAGRYPVRIRADQTVRWWVSGLAVL